MDGYWEMCNLTGDLSAFEQRGSQFFPTSFMQISIESLMLCCELVDYVEPYHTLLPWLHYSMFLTVIKCMSFFFSSSHFCCPEVNLCSWQDIKIQLPNSSHCCMSLSLFVLDVQCIIMIYLFKASCIMKCFTHDLSLGAHFAAGVLLLKLLRHLYWFVWTRLLCS